jgi:hypothetical protein
VRSSCATMTCEWLDMIGCTMLSPNHALMCYRNMVPKQRTLASEQFTAVRNCKLKLEQVDVPPGVT